jgi:hypothetical protein
MRVGEAVRPMSKLWSVLRAFSRGRNTINKTGCLCGRRLQATASLAKLMLGRIWPRHTSAWNLEALPETARICPTSMGFPKYNLENRGHRSSEYRLFGESLARPSMHLERSTRAQPFTRGLHCPRSICSPEALRKDKFWLPTETETGQSHTKYNTTTTIWYYAKKGLESSEGRHDRFVSYTDYHEIQHYRPRIYLCALITY